MHQVLTWVRAAKGTHLRLDRDVELLLEQTLPVEAAVPLVLHHAPGRAGRLPQPLAFVDLEELADDVLGGLGGFRSAVPPAPGPDHTVAVPVSIQAV